MQNNTQVKIPDEAFDWYDAYAHGMMGRREFMDRLKTVAVGGVTMAMLTGALIPNYAEAQQVSFNDEEIKATYVTYASPDGHGEGRGYLVQPSSVADGETAPTVLVVHENRGLNPYVKDVARRLAKSGFVALAPDALHPLGG
ncbi:MAG: dienelactone hydrolase family protein, partial [Emcibacteraceae bacterium]|nr:dienelactone hydrolase family protein [Emcibacteraceae bacterium]